MKKQELRVFYVDVTDYFEGDLGTLVARLSSVLPMATNPERMDIRVSTGYDESAEIGVTGYRMETDEELAARVKVYEDAKREKRMKEKQARVLAEFREGQRLREEEEAEQELYNKLKAKYDKRIDSFDKG